MSVAEVRERGKRDLYPTEILPRCSTALVLFAAAFLGEQEAVWIEEAGMMATCVDNDAERLREMKELYPARWSFVPFDAYDFAKRVKSARMQWDLVSVDCPSGAFPKCERLLPLWCSLARVAVVLGTAPGRRVTAPDGWRVSRTIRRSPIANWTVLERL